MSVVDHRLVGFAVVVLCLALLGCESEQQAQPARSAQVIQDSDSCHVCGMYVNRFPGPKGQAFVHNQPQAFNFCSTQDLFSWLQQPETGAIVREVYVHDMGSTDWQHPDDQAFIDAHNAWYVVGHDQPGAMGPTLASFVVRTDAQAFAARHGGHVLDFDAIDLETLAAPY